MQLKLFTFLAICAIAASSEDEEFWSSSVEEESYCLEFMRRITEVSFQLPKIPIVNCSSGEPVDDVYELDSSVIWDFRHDLYNVYEKYMRMCRNKKYYPKLEACVQCMKLQRIQMTKDVDILFNIVAKVFENVVTVNKKICDDLTNRYLINIK
ncbi:PREDICTED: uncharacterized protein LOC108562455 [Nicrophorus vespilloides]|uniref:Uncharacterized protein LOC108562455 n=1 Tax=Nicrophorus vespilloides TaxID=110193 RepID=A0ABM1MNZ4_NICVS|nr:PREDICTED: uncharacterized protein LOC108562455 [Nicrophorus vespilloides]